MEKNQNKIHEILVGFAFELESHRRIQLNSGHLSRNPFARRVIPQKSFKWSPDFGFCWAKSSRDLKYERSRWTERRFRCKHRRPRDDNIRRWSELRWSVSTVYGHRVRRRIYRDNGLRHLRRFNSISSFGDGLGQCESKLDITDHVIHLQWTLALQRHSRSMKMTLCPRNYATLAASIWFISTPSNGNARRRIERWTRYSKRTMRSRNWREATALKCAQRWSTATTLMAMWRSDSITRKICLDRTVLLRQ